MKMKKIYLKPQTEVIEIQQTQVILAGSGDEIYNIPQPPGSALSREFDWEE